MKCMRHQEPRPDHLVAVYGPPGAFAFSLVGVSFAVLDATGSTADLSYVLAAQILPSLVFALIGEFFAAAELTWLDGVGHFSPIEAPERFAAAVITAAKS